MEELEIYSEEEVYDELISPLIIQIIDICNENNIPMVASFAFENCEENGPGLCTTYINNKENRYIDRIWEAVEVLRRKDHKTFAITVTSSGE